MSVSIEGSGSITGVSTFYNATFSGITTFADNINFDANIAGVTTFLGVGVTSLNVLGVSTFTGQLNAGTISATTLSATTVSIAGTLTYQDVTNIDSVGVITARSGINVTGGNVGIGTDNADFGLHVYGAGDILIEDSANGSAHLRLRSSNNGTDVSNWKIKTSSNNFLYIENDTVGGAPAFTIDNSAKIGIKDATPSVSLDLASTTDAVALPQGTTAQRPTGSAPYIRKNTTNNALEYYDGTSWVEIITDYFPTGSVILG